MLCSKAGTMERRSPNNRRRLALAAVASGLAAAVPAAASSSVTGAGGLRRRREGCIDHRQCVSPATGLCEDRVACFADPCETDPCADGEACAANYCGGCHPVCTVIPRDAEEPVTVILSEPIPVSSCVRGKCPHPKTGRCEVFASCLVNPCDGSPCADGEVCAANYCGGCHPVCSPAEPVLVSEPSLPDEDDPVSCAVGTDGFDVEPCLKDSFCKLAAGDCNTKIAVHSGRCAYKSEMCIMMHDPVCGCDGNTYSNECIADGAGVSVSHLGPCVKDDGPEPAVPSTATVPPINESEPEETIDACAPMRKNVCKRDRNCKYNKKKQTCYTRGQRGGGDKPKKDQEALLDEGRPEKYWPTGAHPASTNGVHGCIKSSDYPGTYLDVQTKLGIEMLFDTYEECCSAYPCSAADVAGGMPTNPLDLPPHELLNYWSEVVPDELLDGLGDVDPYSLLASVHCSLYPWHMSLSAKFTCTNSEADPYWAAMKGATFYGTAQECCDAEFAGMECHMADACPELLGSEGTPVPPKTLDELLNEIDPVPLATPAVDPILSEGPGPDDIPMKVDPPTEPFLSDPVGATVPNVATFPMPEATEAAPLGDISSKVETTKPASCQEGECLSHQGHCARRSDNCQVDPCYMMRCEAGTECVVDTCGGCHAFCSQTETVASDVDAPKTEYWWPVREEGRKTCIYSSDYPDHFTNDGELTFLFESKEACCSAYSACDTEQVGFGDERWYLHRQDKSSEPSCKYGSDYPHEYLDSELSREAFLFDSEADCCRASPWACLVEEEATAYWHPAIAEGTPDCVYGTDYPIPFTSTNHTREVFLFESEVDCCATYPEACEDQLQAEEPSDKGVYWHPTLVGDRSHCVYGSDYPDPTANVQPLGLYLFESEAKCCTAYPAACVTHDTGDPWQEEFLHVTRDADLTDLPWDYGDPPGWEVDDAVSASSENTELLQWDAYWLEEQYNADNISFDKHSFTNIPVFGMGARSDLSLHIDVPDRATLRCLAQIDVHMPFEKFEVLVNGSLRDVYIKPEEGWMQLLLGFSPGFYTVVFRIENGPGVPVGYKMDRGVDGVGDGHVWLDQCQLIGHT